MIAALTGELRRVLDDRIHLQAGPVLYELLVPASDVQLHQQAIGSVLTLHTIFYLEGDSSGGSMDPKLIGFVQSADKRFFEKFVTVKGIGPRKALRALVHPAGEVARAIEEKDTRFLVALPQIGKRLAEQIVAELAGKVAGFAAPTVGAAAAVGVARHSAIEEEAIAALIALGERRAEAEQLLQRARQASGAASPTAGANDLVREMLRLRSA